MTDASVPARAAADAAALFEAAGLGTWSWDRDRDEVTWSPLLEGVHALSRGEFAGTAAACLELIHPDDRDRVVAAIRATLAAGDDHALEYRIVRPDGGIRWVRSWGRVLRDGHGEATGLLGVAMDITDGKTAAAALRERERLFRTVFDAAAAGIGLWELDGTWVSVNDALRAMLGYGPDDPFPPRVQAITHPDDGAADEALYRSLVAGEIDRYAVEKRYLRKDGSVVWGHVTVSRVPGDDGAPRYGLGIVENIGERKAAEAERDRLVDELAAERTLLETTLEQLPIGVVIADAASGRVALANARMDALVGETADPTAPPILRDEAGGSLPPATDPLRRAIAGGEPVAGVEARLTRPDGTDAAVLVNAAPIRSPEGRVVAGVATFDDISERQRAETRRAFLAEVSEFLAESLGDDSTLTRLAEAAVPTLADLCVIDLVDGDAIRTVALVGERAAAVRALDAAFPPGPDTNHLVSAAIRTGRVQWQPVVDEATLARSATSPEHLALLRGLGKTSFVCVPLHARGRVLGAVTLTMNESGRRFDAEDRRLAEEFARRVAVSVDNSRLLAGEQAARRQAERATKRMARLQRLTAALASAITLDDVAGIVLDEGIAALGARAGSLVAADRERGELRVVRAVGYPAAVLDPWRTIPLEASVAIAEAARTRSSILLGTTDAILSRYPGIADVLAETKTQAQAAIPILSGGDLLAVIGLSFAEPRPFDADTRTALEAVAHQSALALERVRLLDAERQARAQAEAARGRLAFLAEASAALGASLDYLATMRRLAGLLTPRLADWAMIHLVTPDGRVELLELVHADPAQSEWAERLEHHYRNAPLSATLRRVLESGESVLMPTITPEMIEAGDHEPGHRALLLRLGINSAMIVPLAAHDEALGAISLGRAGDSPRYTDEDLAFARDLADRAAVAIANARHYLAEERARRYAEAATRRTVRLQTITAALSGALTQEAVAAVLVEQGSAALGARGGTVAVADRAGGYRIVLSTDFPDDIIERWRHFGADADLALAEAIRTRTPVLLPGPAAIDGRYPHLAANRTRVGYRAYAAIPMLADERAVGAVGLTFAEPREFAGEDVALMLALGRQSAQAMERARLYEAERAARNQAEGAEARARREAARIAALATLSRAFVEAGPDYATAIDAVARITAEHTGDGCVIRIISDDGHWADVVALHHPDPAKEPRFREFATPRQQADEGFSAMVLESGRPLLVPDVAAAPAAPDRAPHHRARLAEAGVTGLLVVPLRARGRRLGTLALLRDRPDPPLTEDDAGFIQELADRAALAIDNARLYQEAREAVRARDEFLSVAAHELRTPVTTVKGYAQMLLRSQRRAIAPERTLQFLTAIDEAGERLRLLTEDLLDVSRLRLGQLPLRPRETDLVALARAVAERFAEQLGARHPIRLRVDGDPPAVWADPDRVDQILSNLIDNAAKYSPDGGEIALAVVPEDGGVRLTVADQGIGLPPGEAEAIFEPFNRATNATRENLPGLGLGLSICRSIAERHGGRIWAESAGEGQGTRFSLWLPHERRDEET